MTYQRSFHVEAQVTKVFDFLRDPSHWAELKPEGVMFKDVRLTEEGVGTHYAWTAKVAGVSIEGFNVFTECLPNRRIVDRSSSRLEGTWTYSLAADGSGTKLTVENQVQSYWRLPVLEHLLDRVTASKHEPRFAQMKAMLEEQATV